MVNKKRYSALILFLLITLSIPYVYAEDVCSKVSCYPKTVEKNGLTLYLLGKADFKYLFVNIYSVALYVDQEKFTGDVLAAHVPKFLHFKYHREIERERLVSGALDNLKDNPKLDYESFRATAEKLGQYYSDVRDGDQYFLTYIPGKGLTLSDPTTTFTTVREPDFAAIYLGIWLSDYPLSKRVRDQLLGRK